MASSVACTGKLGRGEANNHTWDYIYSLHSTTRSSKTKIEESLNNKKCLKFGTRLSFQKAQWEQLLEKIMPPIELNNM